MTHELAKQPAEQRLLQEWLLSLAPKTRENYRDGLKELCLFMAISEASAAFKKLFSMPQGEANELALGWKNWLSAKHAPATVNMRLSMLRTFSKVMHSMGQVGWIVSVKNVKAQAYKDTRGPGEDGIKKLIEAARDQNPAIAARDIAIIQLLFGQAFRRESVAALDLEDLDPSGRAMIHWKGQTEKIEWPLGKESCEAINEWLKHRGGEPGPLFWPQTPTGALKRGKRLNGKTGIYPVIKRLAKKAGIEAWPHGLRHTGTTAALDRTNGDVRSVARFTGHKDVRIVLRYDDNRREVEREISDLVSRPKEGK